MTEPHGDPERGADALAPLGNDEWRMDSILGSVPDAVVTIDGGQIIRAFHRDAEKILGYGASEIIGQPLEVLIPDSFRGDHQEHVAGFLTDAESVRRRDARLELSGRRKDGTLFPPEATIVRHERPDGQWEMTAILRDLTERRRLRKLP